MALWTHWWNAIVQLRPAFSRERSFLWFALCVAGLCVRSDNLGVTSIVRALSLDGSRYYHSLLRCCHSKAIKLNVLGPLWTRTVLRLFGDRIERINARPVVLIDGKKTAKEGRKMPGVKSLHQESDSNTKPAYIMGHSCQSASVLARADETLFAVPLDIKIHEGLIFSNRDKRTLLDKMVALVRDLQIEEPCYVVGDRYYANGKMVKGLLDQGHHLVTRAKSNAVANHLPPERPAKPGPGRPRKYGDTVKLSSLYSTLPAQRIASPVYGEKNVTVVVRTIDLLWEPAGRVVRFVLVDHPSRGRMTLLSTDLTLDVSDIIRLYGLRFKIELAYKQAAHVIGTFDYHFWMMDMRPLRRRNGNQYMHRMTEKYRRSIRRKLHAYHVFMFMGVVSQGLMQYLSACCNELVWSCFGSWLRTIRKGVAPSEMVVKMSMRNTMNEFLSVCPQDMNIAKFIIDRQNRHPEPFLDKAA